MKHFLLALLMIAIGYTALAQDKSLSSKNKRAVKEYNKGVEAFKAREDADAETCFLQALIYDPKFVEPCIMLGTLYEGQRRWNKAIEFYEKSIAIDKDFFPNTYMIVATLQHKTGLYEDALRNYTAYLQVKNLNPGPKQQAEIGIKSCNFAIEQKNNPKPFKPVALGKGVNTQHSEYLPALTADEETVIFTRLIPATGDEYGPSKQEDFYMSKKVNGQWKTAVPLSKRLNSPLNEGAHCISPDGQILYFTACNREAGKGQCDIYMSKMRDGDWDYPVNIQELNTAEWESQPSITPDGRTMYFASGRYKKNYDLFVSTFNDSTGLWGEPKRLPDNINTTGVEQTPFIHQDGTTLYFTSEGHLGMGGQDIFYAKKLTDSTWSDPVNIGFPINTYADEACLHVSASGQTAYFASGDLEIEKGEAYNIDIYSFELYPEARPIPVTYFKGIVSDALTGIALKAAFELTDLSTGRIVARSNSDENGSFLICIPTGRQYMLNVSSDKHLFYSENFNLTEVRTSTDPYIKNVEMQPLSTGGTVVLNNIFFDTDKADLKPESYIELEKLYTLLVKNPTMKIEISGHTDNTGAKQHNMVLSENRAKAVVTYLTGKGIAANRMTYKGYGDTSPITTNETPEGRAQNRRTELKIISY